MAVDDLTEHNSYTEWSNRQENVVQQNRRKGDNDISAAEIQLYRSGWESFTPIIRRDDEGVVGKHKPDARGKKR